jgi:hypothetical protein
VPPDCDLRGLPWMPIDTVRLLDSDLWALSTGEEFKAALKLWCKAWQQVPASSLPEDDRILASLSGTGRLWAKVKPMALRGFVKCSDGRLYHPVIAEKALDAWGHRKAQRERAVKRWEKYGNAAAYAVAQPTADAAALPGTGTGTEIGNKPQPRSRAAKAAPAGFDEFWTAYPKRTGNNPRGAAERAFAARLRDGVTASAMTVAAASYARFCEATGKGGSEYVMRASTFLGPDRPYAQQWAAPKANGNWMASPESMLAKAKELGISTMGETTEGLRRRIQEKLQGVAA